MSLNWDLGRNAKKIKEAYPPRGTEMNPITWTLIMVSPAVGIGEITEKSAPDFWFRLTTLNKLNGTPDQISPRDVLAHIGLRTNALSESHVAWVRRVFTSRRSEAFWAFEAERVNSGKEG